MERDNLEERIPGAHSTDKVKFSAIAVPAVRLSACHHHRRLDLGYLSQITTAHRLIWLAMWPVGWAGGPSL